MSNEHRRKLSLGDIIRKMNEKSSSSKEGGNKDSPVTQNEQPQETKRFSPPTFPAIDLPPQPSYKENSSGMAPARPAEPKTKSCDETDNTVRGEPQGMPEIEPLSNGLRQPLGPFVKQPGTLPLTQSSEPDEEEEFDIFRYISVLIRRKEIVMLATIVMGLYSLFSYLRSTRYYTVSARLLFKPYEETIIERPAGWRYGPDRERNFNTHLELLKSDIVLERVSQSLGNKIKVNAIAGGLKINQGETEGKENDIIELVSNTPTRKRRGTSLMSYVNSISTTSGRSMPRKTHG